MAYFPNSGQINMSGATTDWRLLLSEDERKINVGRLYKGLELLNQPPTYRFHLSKQWENDSYNSANSKDEYNQLIGAKLRDLTNKIQRSAQIRQQQQQTQRNAAPSQQSQQQQQAQAQRFLLQQQQRQVAAAQIAAVQAQSNNFIRPAASQVPSSPKPTQPGAHRPNLLQQQVLNNLGIPPDTQLSPEVLKRINAYMAMLPNNVTIQSPVNPMKGQAPSQSPGTMFMMPNAGPSITNSLGTTPSQSPAIVNSSPVTMSNKTTPNMSPNSASAKLAAANLATANLAAPQLKIPQNKLVSSAVQNASVAPNLGIKVPSGVGINTVQNLGLMSGFQGANATIGRPNVIMHTTANSAANANAIMLAVNSNNAANQGIVASNGAKAAMMAAQNAMFANATRPSMTQPLNMSAVRPKFPIMRPNVPNAQMPIINNSTTQPGSLATLTEKEEKEALAMISQIDSRAREKNIQYHEIDLSEEDKRQIRIKLQELTPMYKKVDEVLPYFWHYTRSSQGTYRLLGMKYMIEDQLNALPSGKYLLKLDLVENLLQQFRKYFVFVDSRRRGIEDTSGLMNIHPLPTTQRHVSDSSGTSGSSSIPAKKRQSSVDQDVQQSNKRQQTNSNSINRTVDGTQNISAEILTNNTANPNNPIVIPDDAKQPSSEALELDKNGTTTEDYHAGSQLLTNKLNKLKSISPRVMRSGPTMAPRQMIEGYSSCEESEQRAIMVSLINTA
ncbi:285_t:CDS:2 [Dentiscutata erythropus]|uniref:285_t:CDS:1 n=1 Tax=Dentiscutata erythropus TaxID=1348616 RepID=A0A9N9DD17_9GLOM|nr:285_t:CDS:2 [Dentiscutata erythropus]